jgi:hypothetical protein
VHYVVHYIISFQNTLALQHKKAANKLRIENLSGTLRNLSVYTYGLRNMSPRTVRAKRTAFYDTVHCMFRIITAVT